MQLLALALCTAYDYLRAHPVMDLLILIIVFVLIGVAWFMNTVNEVFDTRLLDDQEDVETLID